jgi:hypothetical protein
MKRLVLIAAIVTCSLAAARRAHRHCGRRNPRERYQAAQKRWNELK